MMPEMSKIQPKIQIRVLHQLLKATKKSIAFITDKLQNNLMILVWVFLETQTVMKLIPINRISARTRSNISVFGLF